jgi:hypothetical protein
MQLAASGPVIRSSGGETVPIPMQLAASGPVIWSSGGETVMLIEKHTFKTRRTGAGHDRSSLSRSGGAIDAVVLVKNCSLLGELCGP